MNELWQPVPGWEDLYEVSDRGNIRSLRSGKLLKGWGLDYRRFVLSAPGRKSRVRSHRLMWVAFNGPVPEGLCVLHGAAEGEERHHLSNLSLGTHKENLGRDRKRDGTLQNKLSDEDVRFIKDKLKAPYWGLNTELGRMFGVTKATITQIKKGKTWNYS